MHLKISSEIDLKSRPTLPDYLNQFVIPDVSNLILSYAASRSCYVRLHGKRVRRNAPPTHIFDTTPICNVRNPHFSCTPYNIVVVSFEKVIDYVKHTRTISVFASSCIYDIVSKNTEIASGWKCIGISTNYTVLRKRILFKN